MPQQSLKLAAATPLADSSVETAAAPPPHKKKREPFFQALTTPVASLDWDTLGLNSRLLADVRDRLGFAAPTTVQQATIPVLLGNYDALVRARTGSGKTLAYLLPVIQDLASRPERLTRQDGTFAIVLAPTRELVLQIYEVLQGVLHRSHWIVPGYLTGGESRKAEKTRLRKGVTILVCTPGRLLDHLDTTASFALKHLSWIVLDEADRLLDLGFEKKVARIVHTLHERQEQTRLEGATSVARHNVLVSATLTDDIEKLASISLRRDNTIFVDADRVAPVKSIDDDDDSDHSDLSDDDDDDSDHSDEEDDDDENEKSSKKQSKKQSKSTLTRSSSVDQPELETPDTLRQFYALIPCKNRLAVLLAFLREKSRRKVIVFVSNRDSVEFHFNLFLRLRIQKTDGEKRRSPAHAKSQHPSAEPFFPQDLFRMHGSMTQLERRETFERFRSNASGVLICTDVAARGWDMPDLAWVVQYDPPDSASEYIHRVGRTARAGAKGSSLIFLMPSEADFVQLLRDKGLKMAHRPLATMVRSVASIGLLSAAEASRIAQKTKAGSMSEVHLQELQLRCERLVEGVNQIDPRLEKLKKIKQKALGREEEDEEEEATLKDMAVRAFGSAVRAYSTHSAEMKHIFHPKKLHLGHYAKSLALREAPTHLGHQSSTMRAKPKLPSKGSAPHRHTPETLARMNDKAVLMNEFAAN